VQTILGLEWSLLKVFAKKILSFSILLVLLTLPAIAQSEFDAEFYLSRYSDLRKQFGTNYKLARNHWNTYGIKEGRQGCSELDAGYYLSHNSDLQKAFGSTNYKAAINHWNTYGIKEGRRGSREFDVRFYLSYHPDLQKAFGNNYAAGVNHWRTYGIREGRKGCP
jgi:hypothetical protein